MENRILDIDMSFSGTVVSQENQMSVKTHGKHAVPKKQIIREPEMIQVPHSDLTVTQQTLRSEEILMTKPEMEAEL